VIPAQIDDWTCSEEDDLAILPIEHRKYYTYMCINTDAFLTKEIAFQEADVGIGDEVFMVGRFMSHDGKQKNSPSLRWGHISTIPDKPVYHPSNKSGHQESFLVEIHSISGYSGSPVFVRSFPTQKLRMGTATNTSVTEMAESSWRPAGQPTSRGPWLLGVEWGYISSHEQSLNNTGISGVVPAWSLLGLLNIEKLKMMRTKEQRSLVDRVREGGTALT
jgi:hypothetical protein